MALASELAGLAIVLATRPFLLVKLACLVGLRACFVVLRTWLEITKAAVSLHVSLFWKMILWTVAILLLPFRILAALQRERQLESSLRFLRVELEDLIGERDELEERYGRAVRERKMLEFMLTELEDDYEKVLTRLEMLEEELQIMRVENLRLKGTRGKDYWDPKGQQDEPRKNHGRPTSDAIDALLRELSTRKTHAVTDNSDSLRQLINLLNKSGIIALEKPEIPVPLWREREAALKRSLFSVMLSLFVGATIWEAGEPCAPLVAALFTVVAISLVSVLRFISTISKRPAFDAAALLSLNWFILGTLSYPIFPVVARISGSPSLSLVHHVMELLSGSISRVFCS
ncbi:hypothetical protein MLD38_016594 [Melastoma candidum]|uniref:Uncharacterized protein n=1 Tax=Melastoma candidum TaxID=119954 RepID=A0ACB9QP32_9MYRT|nr:hypothetical protein MLD38_016594 [Melastoma candidum]